MAEAFCSCTTALRARPSLLDKASESRGDQFSAPPVFVNSIQSSCRRRLANRQRVTWRGDFGTGSSIRRLWNERPPYSRRHRGPFIISNGTKIPVISALSLREIIPSSVLAGGPLLLCASIPIAITLFISMRLNLGLEREVSTAVLRASAQLATLGFALKVVFEGKNVVWSILAMIAMVAVAGQTSGERAKTLPYSYIVTTVALVGGAFTTVWLMVLLKVFPLEPRYLIPATGFTVGISMTVVATTLNYIQDDVRLHEQQIEAAMALGATPHQAMENYVRKALVRALSPIFDHVKVAGLVTLPGTLTGMLMSGSQPLEAVRQSLMLLYMLLGAASLTAVLGAQIGWRLLFSNTMQLLKTS